MGSAITKVTDGVGDLLGNAFMAPLKSIFGQSCEGVCSGPWSVLCFIEHLCVSNLLRLLMILVLCYITLLFFYILCKLGLCRCIGKSLCRMCWSGCKTYWIALEDITCFLWHKLLNTKRVNRHRRRRHHQFRDTEQGYGYSSSDEPDFSRHNKNHVIGAIRYNGSFKRRRREQSQYSFRSSQHVNHRNRKPREVSIHVKGGSRKFRGAGQLQLSKARSARRDKAKVFKKRRLN